MSFLVDDLLDFAQLNAGKFRKVIKEFDLGDAIAECISIQHDKAKMMGIKLRSHYKMQLTSNNCVSLFNKKSQKKSPRMNKDGKDDDASEEGEESEEKDQ